MNDVDRDYAVVDREGHRCRMGVTLANARAGAEELNSEITGFGPYTVARIVLEPVPDPLPLPDGLPTMAWAWIEDGMSGPASYTHVQRPAQWPGRRIFRAPIGAWEEVTEDGG